VTFHPRSCNPLSIRTPQGSRCSWLVGSTGTDRNSLHIFLFKYLLKPAHLFIIVVSFCLSFFAFKLTQNKHAPGAKETEASGINKMFAGALLLFPSSGLCGGLLLYYVK